MSKADDYVSAVMSAPVIQVAPDATVAQALRTMIDRDIGSVVVAEGESAVEACMGEEHFAAGVHTGE